MHNTTPQSAGGHVRAASLTLASFRLLGIVSGAILLLIGGALFIFVAVKVSTDLLVAYELIDCGAFAWRIKACAMWRYHGTP